MNEPIPITLLTGFLGSGKTTLLKRLLARAEMADTAVLVNEFGEVALDHQLLWGSSENIVLMESGCLCCALRSDLSEQLDELYSKRRKGEIPSFTRIVIETTGLADPAPIMQTLVETPIIASLYRLDGVVTTVDAVYGMAQLDERFEPVKQAALADRLLITKSDLADEAALAALERRLRQLNPAAPIERIAHGDVEPSAVLNAGLYDAARKAIDPSRWLKLDRYRPAGSAAPLTGGKRPVHDAQIDSFSVIYEHPVSGERLWQALEMLMSFRGADLLRVKGIVNVEGQDRPRVLHIVQHTLYPVVTLPAWPDADRRTRLVFIVRNIEAQFVRRTLAQFLAGEPSAAG